MNKKSLALVLGGALALVSVGVITGVTASEPDSKILAPGAPGVDYSNTQSF
jgi:hypothetical protein